MVVTINIKKDMPNADYAVFLIDKEIMLSDKTNINVIIAIHGYGSSGKGGVIKKDLHKYLNKMKTYNKIVDYIPGEMWSDLNEKVKEMQAKYPELILNSNLANFNNGVTVIWIKKW